MMNPSRMRSNCRRSWIIVLFVLLPAWAAAADNPVEIRSGVIGDALYTIARPDSWQGRVLMIAHGLRPQSEALDASLNIKRQIYHDLLASGWIVAISSYRRNGVIINDAIEDLDLLRKHIETVHGKPDRVLVMGSSMGGAIGTLIAENRYADYDGILAIGAALRVRNNSDAQKLNHDPQIPILFLTNQSELQAPQSYVRKTANATVPPALWLVKRDGHVNVNDRERLAALHALNQFIETGQLERDKDGTIAGSFNTSSARFFADGAEAVITDVTANHGNIFTGFIAADLQQIGIHKGKHFSLTLRGQTVSVLWGVTYHDVKRGEWVAFISGEGNLMIARNFLDACKSMGCEVGDRLLVRPEL